MSPSPKSKRLETKRAIVQNPTVQSPRVQSFILQASRVQVYKFPESTSKRPEPNRPVVQNPSVQASRPCIQTMRPAFPVCRSKKIKIMTLFLFDDVIKKDSLLH